MVDLLCGIARMVLCPRHRTLLAYRTIHRRGRAIEVLQWVCGLVRRVLLLHWRLAGLHLLHRHLLLATVIIALGMSQRRRAHRLWLLRHDGLLVLVSVERGGAEGLVGVLICGACLHGRDGRVALVDAGRTKDVSSFVGWRLEIVRRETSHRGGPYSCCTIGWPAAEL